jgi:hypothetical protein
MMIERHDLRDEFEGGVRATDPDTSWRAALRDLSRRRGDRVRALRAHCAHPLGLTDFELADVMHRQQTSAGKRRGEIRDMGLIEDSTLRRRAPSGSPAIVWVVTRKGRWVFSQLIKEGWYDVQR